MQLKLQAHCAQYSKLTGSGQKFGSSERQERQKSLQSIDAQFLQSIEIGLQEQQKHKFGPQKNTLKHVKYYLNSHLVESISGILNDINHGVFSNQLQQALKRPSTLTQKIFLPIKELEQRIKLNSLQTDHLLEYKLSLKYEQCKIHKQTIMSLQRQLQLVNKNLQLKTDEISNMKNIIKVVIGQNIKLKNQKQPEKKDENLMKVHSQYKKYIQKLYKIYDRKSNQPKVLMISELTNDESFQIDNLITKLQQSINYHEETFSQLLQNHQREIADIKLRYQEELHLLASDLQHKFQTQFKEQASLHKLQQKEAQASMIMLKQKISQLQNRNKDLHVKLDIKKKEKEELSKSTFQVYTQETLELRKQIALLAKEKEREMSQKQQLLIKMEETASKNSSIYNNSSLQKMLQFHKVKLKESEQKLALANKKINSIVSASEFKKIYPDHYVDNIFVNEILDTQPQFKLFLKNTLEIRYKSKIFRTKLLYKYDQLNKNNFHLYIDNKDNIFALVKLVNGNIVACFSQGKIYPKMIADKDGLLISVTNKEVFQLAEANKKAVFYDDSFFILGNSQFKVKSGQLKFFSNFAASNGSYRPRGLKVNVITGCNDRQVGLANLEFYQIVFY